MPIDVLVAEIGSTTTVVSAFDGVTTERPQFLGQGLAATSVAAGDVTIGLEQAIGQLRKKRGGQLDWQQMFATSSAAGGLRMSVHGLVYEMTVRAAREAALGSGAVLIDVTAGRLRGSDLDRLARLAPRMLLLAGGVDYGERDTALYNFERLLPLLERRPLVYAGNRENQEEIRALAEAAGVEVFVTENVYPEIDCLNVVPARAVIQQVFERHIVDSPGMERIRQLVNGPILPTPGAVMKAAELLYQLYGDAVVLDVGGATTDVHSVTEGSDEIRRLATAPEPFAKRTVEGDLGVFVNRHHVALRLKEALPPAELEELLSGVEEAAELPAGEKAFRIMRQLTRHCAEAALARHAGRLTEHFSPGGRRVTASGRDLSAVKVIVGTGGALTRLGKGATLLGNLRRPTGSLELYPPLDARILLDADYVMASLGVLSLRYPEAAKKLLAQSLEKSVEPFDDGHEGER